MNWPAIGAIAELLGAAGVIASLLYLARQIRNSAAEGRRAAAEAVLTKMMTAFQRTSAHPQLADAFLRGSTDLTSLSPQEALQFSSLLHSFVRPYEELVYARRAGAVEEWVWDNGERSISASAHHTRCAGMVGQTKDMVHSGAPGPHRQHLARRGDGESGGIGKVAERQGLQGWRACRDERPGP